MAKRKQISFDIDTKVGKKIFGEQSYTKIYADIRRFMKKEGWKHIEGSVYMSDYPMSNSDVVYMVKELKKQYPYMEKCVREIHQADVSNVHSLNQYFSYDGTPGQYEQQENRVGDHKREPPEKPSVRRQLEENKVRVKKNEQNKEPGDRENSHHNRDER